MRDVQNRPVAMPTSPAPRTTHPINEPVSHETARAELGGTGQHGMHARRLPGTRRIDRENLGVGMLGAQDMAVQQARQLQIVRVAPAASQKAWILRARHRLASRELSHASLASRALKRVARLASLKQYAPGPQPPFQ